jgi:hypothetical protein
MNQRTKLENRIAEKTSELHKIQVEVGRENTRPRYEQDKAKIHNGQRDVEKIHGEIDRLYTELVELVDSPKYQRELNEKLDRLESKRSELTADLSKGDAILRTLANDALLDVASGGDPLDWAQKEAMLKEQAEVLARAIYFVNRAWAHLTRPIPAAVNPPAEWIGRLPEVAPPY